MCKDINIYYTEYITTKRSDDYENTNSVNSLYVIIGKVDGHIECNIVEEKNESKYLVFDPTDENKEEFKKYKELGDGIKNKIETINGGYGKDFMKIKLETGDNLLMNIQLNIKC